jgi:hypothetical protein
VKRFAIGLVLLGAFAGCQASAVVNSGGSGGVAGNAGGSGGNQNGGGGSGGSAGGAGGAGATGGGGGSAGSTRGGAGGGALTGGAGGGGGSITGVGAGGSGGGASGAGAGGSGGAGGGAGGGGGSALDCTSAANGSPVLRLLTNWELQNTLNDIFPEVKGQWTSSLPANGVSSQGFDNDATAAVGTQQASGLLDTGLSLATALVGTPLAKILSCSTSSANHACAETFLNKYGRRLFRRSLTTAEHDQYLTFFDQSLAKSDFKTALKWMTVGLIQSPNAVYRSEIGTVQGSARKLSAVELATELAYTYTGSTPSDDLLSKAESGTMDSPATVAAAMLATTAGKETLQRFFASYFDYGNVTAIQKANVSNFSSLSADMVEETRHFIDSIVFQQKGGLKELLTATSTYPSKALAAFYSFPTPLNDYDAVTRPAGRGIGLLAQGAFLATHASSDASSPTRRGLFPFSKLFCLTKPTPPPGVPPIPAPAPGQQTTRQRYELSHASNEPCKSCHKLFDPLGFGFEHFNEAGQYRETESGLTIDASGSYTPPVAGGQPFSFSGQEDLAEALAQIAEGDQCVANYLATYAFGTAQACLGASSVADLESGKIGLLDAFINLAKEPHFQTRDLQ